MGEARHSVTPSLLLSFSKMLDGADKATFYNLRLLRDVVDQRKKPLIIWAGAGVSKWCGYPSWKESAEKLHNEYRRFENTYDRSAALAILEEQDYPRLFDICRL